MEYGHAIVIGAGMSGLAAARVLERFFSSVTILERDELPEGPSPRAGIPQGRHVHALLARGATELEALFPGFLDEYAAAGAHRLDVAQDGAMLRPYGWQRPMRCGVDVHFASRDLTESIVRRRVRASDRIEIRTKTDVTGLLVGPDGRVEGVTASQRGGGQNLRLAADLVVDASGRSSKSPAWLADLGCEVAREQIVDCFSGYASRWYEAPAEMPADVWWKMVWIDPAPAEGHFIGGVLFPIEGNRYIITLIGYSKHYPPSDEDAFGRTLRALRSPVLARMAEIGRPVSPVYASRANQNRLRRYDELSRPLPGFVAVSDSVCTFNPMFGQGMTVAMLSAQALASVLERVSLRDPGFERAFFLAQYRAIKDAWRLATSADMSFPGARSDLPQPSLPARMLGRAIMRAILVDGELLERVMPVYYMMKPMRALFEGDLVRRILLTAARSVVEERLRPEPLSPMPPMRA